MPLVDQDGKPIESAAVDIDDQLTCPRCHSKRVSTEKSFGGYWKKLCIDCGQLVAANH